MEEQEIRMQAVITTLVLQRNESLNTVVDLKAEIAVLKNKIEMLEKNIEKGVENENKVL